MICLSQIVKSDSVFSHSQCARNQKRRWRGWKYGYMTSSHLHYIKTEAHLFHSPHPPPPRPWLCSRLWGLEWSSTVSFLSSENGRETGHTPSVRLLDEGTADSFIKRTWDSSPTPVLKSQLLSITQCVTLNRHNLAESFLSLTFLVTYYTWYTHSCDGYKRLCENAWHTIHFLTYYRFLTNVTWLSLWGSHRLMKTCTLFPFARLNALNSGSE